MDYELLKLVEAIGKGDSEGDDESGTGDDAGDDVVKARGAAADRLDSLMGELVEGLKKIGYRGISYESSGSPESLKCIAKKPLGVVVKIYGERDIHIALLDYLDAERIGAAIEYTVRDGVDDAMGNAIVRLKALFDKKSNFDRAVNHAG